ncbi:hypothetical protein DOY81_009099 [Sarcophaga bullata]|nr:hypothetical protein DOY81_009099 [Sarcophaga bullata]
MPSVCRFELNKPNAVYFSGETIAGTAYLTTTSDKSVRDVAIEFLGASKVKFDERRTYNTTRYRGFEIYIQYNSVVHTEENFPAGTHAYSFNITLPTECPTSIEGEYGRVRYEFVVRINRFYRFDNVFKQQITVLRSVDLNLNPSYKLPTSSEYIRSGCWPCWSGRIMCTLEIPFGGYIPGQLFKYTLLINNQSNSNAGGYSYEFKQKLTYTASHPAHKVRYERKVLAANNVNKQCLRFANRLFEDVFTIPSIPPTTDSNSIVCVEYYLKVKVNIPDCRSNGVLKIPVVMGTISIWESLDAPMEQ